MNGVARYRESEIMSASGARLVVITYDGAIAFLHRARRAFEQGSPQEAPPLIFRSERVVLYLLSCLDSGGGEVASNLSRLYGYVIGRLGEAALARDTGALDEAVEILTDLRSAWAQIAGGEAMPSRSAQDVVLSEGRSEFGTTLSVIG